ncbi:MAG TPA: anion permease, partial [Thermodesulfobacteriota bacterium]|nr:anion permease [Thermodesulfobacteriota bacterium]
MTDQGQDVKARVIRGILVVLVGAIIWFLPVPAGVKKEAWQLLAIFVATIFGLILNPLPMGAVVIMGVVMTLIAGV